MFWNWYTIDACFLFSGLHISSLPMFAAFCIGSFGLVILLELLRRLQRDYDRHISQYQRHAVGDVNAESPEADNDDNRKYDDPPNSAVPLLLNWTRPVLTQHGYVPSAFQQTLRAGLYALQFAVAYIIMLLAMYYNGYVLVCIFVGAFVGFFAFAWVAIESANRYIACFHRLQRLLTLITLVVPLLRTRLVVHDILQGWFQIHTSYSTDTFVVFRKATTYERYIGGDINGLPPSLCELYEIIAHKFMTGNYIGNVQVPDIHGV